MSDLPPMTSMTDTEMFRRLILLGVPWWLAREAIATTNIEKED